MPKTKHPEPEVAVGDVWRCGGHFYACSDLMADDLLARILMGTFPTIPRPTLVYTDPPWGQGLANGFRTKAGLGRATYDWTAIYEGIGNMARLLKIPAWFEGPTIDKPDGLKIPGSIMQGPGHRLYRQISYMGGNPSGLYYASPFQAPPNPEVWIASAGFGVVREVLQQYEPGVLLDPCSGLGGIALEGEKLGWMSVNNELNPERMANALARMADLTGAEPVEIAL